jgi:hypothetical protein
MRTHAHNRLEFVTVFVAGELDHKFVVLATARLAFERGLGLSFRCMQLCLCTPTFGSANAIDTPTPRNIAVSGQLGRCEGEKAEIKRSLFFRSPRSNGRLELFFVVASQELQKWQAGRNRRGGKMDFRRR